MWSFRSTCNLFMHYIIRKLKQEIKLASNMSTVSSDKGKDEIKTMFLKAVESVRPTLLVRNSVQVSNNVLQIRGKQYKLNKNCYLVGFGKAVLGMASEFERIVGSHLVNGILSIPEGIQETLRYETDMFPKSGSVLKVLEGAKNNLPDKSAEENARKIQALVSSLSVNDILVVMISGGGSALLPLPYPPITLEEKLNVVKRLGSAGADIFELNCVRKRLSLLKGGGLAMIAYPANVISLILSDVIGDPIDFIASGPTVQNNDPNEAALNIINKYSLQNSISSTVLTHLTSITKKRSTDFHDFDHVQNFVVGTNLIAIERIKHYCIEQNFVPVILSSEIQGNVINVAEFYAKLATGICQSITNKSSDNFILWIKEMSNNFKLVENISEEIINKISCSDISNGVVVIAGGETTVTVSGNGLGGRNQQLALTFAKYMSENEQSLKFLKNFNISLLSAGTDGIDGPTDAAGVIGRSEQFTCSDLNPEDYLKNNDTYNFYTKYNNGSDLIKVGHTGTNVMDIHILLIQMIKI